MPNVGALTQTFEEYKEGGSVDSTKLGLPSPVNRIRIVFAFPIAEAVRAVLLREN